MPNQPATPNRAVRIDDETWADLGAAAEAAGTDRSTVLRELAQWWLRRPGAKCRPGRTGQPEMWGRRGDRRRETSRDEPRPAATAAPLLSSGKTTSRDEPLSAATNWIGLENRYGW